MVFQTINPASEKIIKQFPMLDNKEIEASIAQAHRAFNKWRDIDSAAREKLLVTLAKVLDKNVDKYSLIIEEEMGKPVNEAKAEIEKCAFLCRYFAEHGASFVQPVMVMTEATESYISYDPLGIILTISPWNFPFWQVFRVAVPTILAGNVILLKHAANTPQCALAIEEIFLQAGFSPGVFTNLFIDHAQVAQVIAHPLVKGVSLTGSNVAGAKVASLAGHHIKPCVLELGGSDAFIVFPDADINKAALLGAQSRCLNSGQSCINAKRFIVHKDIIATFKNKLKEAMESYSMGPLASSKQQGVVHEQVSDAIIKGALVVCGGLLPPGPGFYYPATVLVNLNPTMRLWHEEVFGPVASIFSFANEDEALMLANGTKFGLGASLWTADKKRMHRFIPLLECGNVFINAMVKSDPRLPFGGVKQSGFGRELSCLGMHSFANIKTVYVD